MLHEAWEFYRTPRCEHLNAPSKVAVRSFDELVQFDAWQFLSLIAPRPLLLIAGTDADTRAHSERALDRAAGISPPRRPEKPVRPLRIANSQFAN